MTDGARLNDEAAVRWAIRLDGAPLSEAEQSELDAWLGEEPRRRGALLRAEAALAYLDRGRALGAPEQVEPPHSLRRRAFLIGAPAAALCAASAFLVLGPVPGQKEISTAVGEVRRVPLADGSLVSVNTGSRLAVAIAEERRAVKLESGEAWFQVAHDAKWSFVVEAGDVRIKAVGTAFSVRRRAGGVDVLVTEGRVAVWRVGRESEGTQMEAGSKAFIADVAPSIEVVAAPADVERALAWRTGELALNGESLAYAASELNRYNRRQIVITDAALGRKTLVGYFRIDQPENFARAVASIEDAEVVVEGETIRLSR